jgi:polyhydroxyalkanoate synthesis regulator phasin
MAEEAMQEQVAAGAEQVVEKVEEAAGVPKKSRVEKAKTSVGATAEQVQKSHVVGLTHHVMLAGLGAGVLAKEETEKLLKVLVDRGTIAEEESRRAMKEAIARRRRRPERPCEVLRTSRLSSIVGWSRFLPDEHPDQVGDRSPGRQDYRPY